MQRYSDKMFYENGKIKDRKLKKKQKLILLKNELSLMKNALERKKIFYSKRTNKEIKEHSNFSKFSVKEQIAINNKEIKNLKDQINEIEGLKSYEHKNLKYSIKNTSNKKLKKIVLNYIRTTKDTQITVEDVAIELKANKGQVFNIFMELNRDGFVSQKKRSFPHDTNRNPRFDCDESGWGSNVYQILKR